jgi:hypothetical protein
MPSRPGSIIEHDRMRRRAIVGLVAVVCRVHRMPSSSSTRRTSCASRLSSSTTSTFINFDSTLRNVKELDSDDMVATPGRRAAFVNQLLSPPLRLPPS